MLKAKIREPGRRALVVQEDPTTAYLLVRLLTRWGYDVAQAFDGDEVWRKLQCWTSGGLVLVDNGLAAVPALDLCRRIKKAGGADVQVILLGGPGDEVSRERAEQAGAHTVLRKPFALPELAACLAGPGPVS